MIASFHVADLPLRDSFRAQRSVDRLRSIDGLRDLRLAQAARLSPSVLPRPSLRRIVLVANWDDDTALDRFLAVDPLAEALDEGWRVRLEPQRAQGSWPGLPADLPTSRRSGAASGPLVVLTLGLLRPRRAVAFFRASARAEAQLLRSPGLLWATGMGRLPFVGTCSVWRDSEALTAFAYGSSGSGHGEAMRADRLDPFHRRSAFVRFRPYAPAGLVDGRNPLELQPADRLERPPVAV